MRARSVLLILWSVLLAAATFLDAGGLGGPSNQPATGLAAPLAAPDNSLILQPFVTSGITQPLFLTHAGDGSGRLFLVERGGKIKIIVNGVVQPTPFLDVSSVITTTGLEQGLLGLAFHPNFKNNGRFFVYYTTKPPPAPTTNVGSNTLVEYQASPASANVADPTPVRTLFSLEDEFENHNGGSMAFSPIDHFLYVGVGDGGGSGDPHGHGQDLGVLFGKLLRLDVDNIPSGENYGIPADNPFVDLPGARTEIWAYGLRNPWRWSFDRGASNPGGAGQGDIYIGDVGQLSWEEVDLLGKTQKGVNFGWSVREGRHCHPAGTPSCNILGMTEPIIEYGHPSIDPQGGCSVTGGYRYRGTAYPALRGQYLYADYCYGKIWRASPPTNGLQPNWNTVEALDTSLLLSSFGEDETGELYILEFLNGGIYKIQASPNLGLTPTATLTQVPTATPIVCSPRPRITVQVTRVGSGRLDALVSATDGGNVGNNVITSMAFTSISNALVSILGRTNESGPFSLTMPGGTRNVHVIAQRQAAGPMTVRMTVNDLCGAWPTFIGGGSSLP